MALERPAFTQNLASAFPQQPYVADQSSAYEIHNKPQFLSNTQETTGDISYVGAFHISDMHTNKYKFKSTLSQQQLPTTSHDPSSHSFNASYRHQ